ncbi:molybdopterin-dependent oxidoreductase [Gordonia rhizosphera]|uniref:Oxidoreductase molybdopterin-binding domain-containing protein n=1 Tax=Gordonia rhizosphera NBRC 16068 TaxID=1108045 RepID=K6WGP6_9ACTN|nr:molybdopterin-dependent oxidoreductase [Gordonia rhizosphera]GAB91307.1 hypothetical protein GORHZ_126_00480 [Gordonia rhizosphera NBRC 16068]
MSIDRITTTSAAAEPLRDRRVTTRVGLALATCFVVCFVTGLLSHWIQHPPDWFAWISRPAWLYRVTQGLHVISGVTAIPLLLVKLGIVYPKLFERPLIGSPVRAIERMSIAVLVSSAIFQLVTGLMNIAQWYPWRFFFPSAHYAMAYVAIGALLIHIAVKLPIIRDALESPVDAERTDVTPPAAPEDSGDDDAVDDEDVGEDDGAGDMTEPAEERDGLGSLLTRRTVLRSAWVAAGIGAVAFAGQTVTPLRRLAVLAPRSGEGPQALPINRTAAQAGIVAAAQSPDHRLLLTGPGGEHVLTLDQLRAMPQHTVRLPIACVEGWSVEAEWTGVRLADLAAMAGHGGDTDVRMVSLDRGLYGTADIPIAQVRNPSTLIALRLNGAELDVDHGYPCRLIAPNLPGVMQTKWLSRIEML